MALQPSELSASLSFARVQPFRVPADRFVADAAVFNPPHLGRDNLARTADFFVCFVLNPTLWRDLNGRDAIEHSVILTVSVANGFGSTGSWQDLYLASKIFVQRGKYFSGLKWAISGLLLILNNLGSISGL